MCKLASEITVIYSLIISIIQFCFASFLAGSRSSSPGKLLGSGYSGLAGGSSRGPPVTSSSEKRSKIPRSQGCSRETSPNRIGLGKDFQRLWNIIPISANFNYNLMNFSNAGNKDLFLNWRGHFPCCKTFQFALFVDHSLFRFPLQLKNVWGLPFKLMRKNCIIMGFLPFTVILQNISIGEMGRIFYFTIRSNIVFHFSYTD